MSEDAAAEGSGPGYFSDVQELDGAADVRCPSCGTSLLDLYKDGRMGCAQCYVTFKSQVHRALIVLHGACAHVGKTIRSESDF